MLFSNNKINKQTEVRNQEKMIIDSISDISNLMDCDDDFKNIPPLTLPISVFDLQKLNNNYLKIQSSIEDSKMDVCDSNEEFIYNNLLSNKVFYIEKINNLYFKDIINISKYNELQKMEEC